MLIPTLPFDYARLSDTTDRHRRTRTRAFGSRVRREVPRDSELQ